MATPQQSEERVESWVSAYVNSSLASPAGYAPPVVPVKVLHVAGPAAQVHEEELSGPPDCGLLGRGALTALRHTLVVLNHQTWPGSVSVAAVVARLSCVGATVVTRELPEPVRDLIPDDLIRLGDILDPETSMAADQHEELSISMRRAAHRRFGYHPHADHQTPSVAVLIDYSSDSAARLKTEFARQENVTVRVVRAKDGAEHDAAADATSDVDVVYVADTRPDVTYGPHYLEDLVQALRHSEADLAFSPDRFEHQPKQGVLLEDVTVPMETLLDLGATPEPGTSLWYRSTGLDERRLNYAVHGCQSLVLPTGPEAHVTRTYGRVRRSLPPQMDWAVDAIAERATPAPSYIARAELAARR